MTYTLTAQPNTIVRDEDGAFIPTDPDNIDYQDYLAWLDEGNEPTPYTPPATLPKSSGRGSRRRPRSGSINWRPPVAETTTANFGWTMPDPGASANTWGATLNATTQKVDAQVFANQQAGVRRLARSPCSAARRRPRIG